MERDIAREIITSGQMLKGDPDFDDVVSILTTRGQGMMSGGSSVTQGWIRENLQDVLPRLDNSMIDAALNAATNEVSPGNIRTRCYLQ